MGYFITFCVLLCQILALLIFIRAIISWVGMNPYSPALTFLRQITEPILEPIRRIIPPIGGTLDIAPLIAIILLQVLARVLASL